jgi:hypothetical protein
MVEKYGCFCGEKIERRERVRKFAHWTTFSYYADHSGP